MSPDHPPEKPIPDRVGLALKLGRANVRIRELEAALTNVTNVLGPQKTCECHAEDCALDLEASEALRVARAALSLKRVDA